MTAGQKLKSVRMIVGMSVEDVAAASNVSADMLNAIERDAGIPCMFELKSIGGLIEQLSDALGVTETFLERFVFSDAEPWSHSLNSVTRVLMLHAWEIARHVDAFMVERNEWKEFHDAVKAISANATRDGAE